MMLCKMLGQKILTEIIEVKANLMSKLTHVIFELNPVLSIITYVSYHYSTYSESNYSYLFSSGIKCLGLKLLAVVFAFSAPVGFKGHLIASPGISEGQ